MAMNDLYQNRKLSAGYPGLGDLAFEAYTNDLEHLCIPDSRFEGYLRCLTRLVSISEGANVLVLGCGPRPVTIKKLAQKGYHITGVEPVASFVKAAAEYVGPQAVVLKGEAESIPLPDNSQDLVFFESVLEHVDSPIKALQEIFRVLVPGGIVYLDTTNRQRISLTGQAGEFNLRFYNWFPDIVKECYVFHHLHYNPRLANYTVRPAVHWFSFADLCELGRDAGFAQFYSFLDLMDPHDQAVSKSSLRRFFLKWIQRSPWLRALALTQFGNHIIMLKRKVI